MIKDCINCAHVDKAPRSCKSRNCTRETMAAHEPCAKSVWDMAQEDAGKNAGRLEALREVYTMLYIKATPQNRVKATLVAMIQAAELAGK